MPSTWQYYFWANSSGGAPVADRNFHRQVVSSNFRAATHSCLPRSPAFLGFNLAGILCVNSFQPCKYLFHLRQSTLAIRARLRGPSTAHMSWLASVHSTVSSDTEPTIVFTFPSAKYVFNTGENTVRSWSERGRSWRKTRCIFLTSIGTQRASGLPGVCPVLSSAPSSYSLVVRFYYFRDFNDARRRE